MSALKTAVLVLFLSLFCYFSSGLLELGQCQRRCREVYGSDEPSVRGRRSSVLGNYCNCVVDDRVLGRVWRWNDWRPPAVPVSVCGVDGKMYASLSEAQEAGAAIMHAGHCGKCSNARDMQAYRDTRHNLTEIATQCAFRNLLFGSNVASKCLQQYAGLSDECTTCWVENMSCTAVHCLSECLWARTIGSEPNKADGSLNDCLSCDEAYCGTMFTECAGANRRRIGVTTDIARSAEEIWDVAH